MVLTSMRPAKCRDAIAAGDVMFRTATFGEYLSGRVTEANVWKLNQSRRLMIAKLQDKEAR
jgi:hypothetical protein